MFGLIAVSHAGSLADAHRLLVAAAAVVLAGTVLLLAAVQGHVADCGGATDCSPAFGGGSMLRSLTSVNTTCRVQL